jgi:hypothetical protein
MPPIGRGTSLWMTQSLLSWAAFLSYKVYGYSHPRHSIHEMANPINVNPANAFRRLTIGGSDWLWVVFTIMILSALAVFVWSMLVGFFLDFRLGAFSLGSSTESNQAESERFIFSL